jgi:hypothetical protein
MLVLPTVTVAAAFLAVLPGLALGQSGPVSPSASPSATSGPAQSISDAAMALPTNAEQVRRRLERDGYREVQNLRPDGDAWIATARKNGKEVMLVLDSHNRIEVMR